MTMDLEGLCGGIDIVDFSIRIIVDFYLRPKVNHYDLSKLIRILICI